MPTDTTIIGKVPLSEVRAIYQESLVAVSQNMDGDVRDVARYKVRIVQLRRENALLRDALTAAHAARDAAERDYREMRNERDQFERAVIELIHHRDSALRERDEARALAQAIVDEQSEL